MIKIFYDCEFTHLFDIDIDDDPGLISIALIDLDGNHCYFENQDFNPENCSYFVQDGVLPYLSWYPKSATHFILSEIKQAITEGGKDAVSSKALVAGLTSFIESQKDEVMLLSDAPSFDWPLIKELFDAHGWPKNLSRKAYGLGLTAEEGDQYDRACELEYSADKSLRRHHALDDVKVIRQAYLSITKTKIE